MAHGDSRFTMLLISNGLRLSRNNVCKIITEDSGMRKVGAKMVPKLLNDEQKTRRMQVCQDIPEHFDSAPDLLTRVISGEERWVFEYDPKSKRQSLH